MSTARERTQDGYAMEIPRWDPMPRIGWDDFMAARVRFLDRSRLVEPRTQDALRRPGGDEPTA